MSVFSVTRRDFLKATAAGAMLGHASLGIAESSSSIRITAPFHGAILNHRHGKKVDDGLKITVKGQAAGEEAIVVNDAPAKRSGNAFEAEIVLRDEETDIVAKFVGHEARSRVVWDRYSYPRYRFTIDDNSFFLRDIAQKQYKSLFDCFYLKMLKDLHAKYNAKFSLNIYYTTGDDFNLTQFPDRYKGEWNDNADWLRLAFHAHANDPPRPYQDAPAEKLLADYDLVSDQIRRFAGEAFSPATVIHFGMTRNTVYKAMASRGIRTLSGYFRPVEGGWDINYSMDPARSEHIWRNDALKDFDSGIIFSRVDIVVNSTPLDKIVPTLEPLTKEPGHAEVMDILTHEQYFWPFYVQYLPDHAQRLDTAIRFVTERGYKPVFFHDGYLGRPA